MPLKEWPIVWKLVTLFEALVVLFIIAGIVEDWVRPPAKFDWASWDAFLGDTTLEWRDHLPALQRAIEKMPAKGD